ncbi:MAG: class I SAM-dependent methyltransferase [Azonexus sp.]
MSLEARLEWRSPIAGHVDRLVINHSALQADGRWLAAGEVLRQSDEVSLDPMPWCQPAGLAPIEVDMGKFCPRETLVAGRFYPRLVFGRLLGSARDTRPVRLIECNRETGRLRVNPNHPLAADQVRMFLRHAHHAAAPGIRLAELFDGPGMQRLPDNSADPYFSASGFQRGDNATDTDFYARPRLTQHLDARCRAEIADLYGRLLQPGMCVLDLMSSIDSHLPEAPAALQISGLGMNQEELSANPRLSERVVQDLIACSALPWRDGNFDCVVNTAAIEYLVRPVEVIAEVERVLRPGGVFAIVFSDRWFPSKAIRIWSEIHPFERLALILSLLQQAGFRDLRSETVRGYQRPQDDKYIGQRGFSDPLFAAWGRKP